MYLKLMIFAWLLACVPALIAGDEPKNTQPEGDFLFPVRGRAVDELAQFRQRGENAMKDGLYDNAIGYFRHYHQLTQKYPEERVRAVTSLAEALVAGEKYGEALMVISTGRLEVKTELAADLRERLDLTEGEALMATGEMERGLKLLLPVCRQERGTDAAYRALCLCVDSYVNGRQEQKALDLLKETKKKFAASSMMACGIAMRQAQCEYALGHYAEAVALLTPVCDNAGKIYDDRDVLMAKLLSVRNYVKLKKLDKAWQDYSAIAKFCPKNDNGVWRSIMWELAVALCDAKEYVKAETAFRQAADFATADEEQVRVALQLSEVQLIRKDVNGARETLVNLQLKHAGDANYSLVTLRLAELMLISTPVEREGAMALFRQVAGNPKVDKALRYRTLIELAECLVEVGELSEAVDCYMKAANLGRNPTEQARAYRFAAEKQARALHRQEALRLYRMLAEKYAAAVPAVADSRLEGAVLLWTSGVHAEAVDEVKLFVKEQPASPRIWEARRYIVLWQWTIDKNAGDRAGLEKEMYQLAEECPDEKISAQLYFDCARCALKAKNPSKTLSIIERLIQRYPKCENLRIALHLRLVLLFQMSSVEQSASAAEAKKAQDAAKALIQQGKAFIDRFTQGKDSTEVAMLCGDYLSSAGDHQGAAQFYGRVPAPQYSGVQGLQTKYELARCKYAAADAVTASQVLTELLDGLETIPENVTVREALKVRLNKLLGHTPDDVEIAVGQRVYAQAAMLSGDLCAEKSEYDRAADKFAMAAVLASDEKLRCAAMGRQAEMMLSSGDVAKQKRALEILNDVCSMGNALPLELVERARFLKARCMELIGGESNLREARIEYQNLCSEYRSDCSAGIARPWRIYSLAVWRLTAILGKMNDDDALRQAVSEYELYSKTTLPRAKEAAARAAMLKNRLENQRKKN